MTETLHKNIPRAENHGIVGRLGPYANAAAREGAILTSDDIDQVAKQTDTKERWMVLDVISGVGTWGLVAAPAAAFSGDFGALFAGYGLTVLAYRRADLGITGTTGTGKSAWANQLGAGGSMGPNTGGTNGIGSIGAGGLNGKDILITDGSTQNGLYTLPDGTPGTTPFHTYVIQCLTATPGGYVHASNGGHLLIKGGATADVTIYNGSAGATTTGEALNQWHRLRASWIGGLDIIRVGSHEPTPVSTSNTARGTNWGFASNAAGASMTAIKCAMIVQATGLTASFLAAAADADAKLATWWAGATAIEI